MIPAASSRRLGLADVAAGVLEALQLTREDFRKGVRHRRTIQARGVAAIVLRAHRVGGIAYSWPEISRAVCGKDTHTSFITAMYRACACDADVALALQIANRIGIDDEAFRHRLQGIVSVGAVHRESVLRYEDARAGRKKSRRSRDGVVSGRGTPPRLVSARKEALCDDSVESAW